jgi:hypothetical protein
MGSKQLMLTPMSRMWEKTPEAVRFQLGIESFKKVSNWVDTFLDLCNHDVSQVVDSLTDAVTCVEPQYFYRVGAPAERLALSIIESLPEELQDTQLAPVENLMILRYLRRKFNI